jgi:alkanesulfonate monooxygenase SsuD/methylene tetrahydromethanopterin reductase-like flavin-dependent oxidoreductase (luciferase family)
MKAVAMINLNDNPEELTARDMVDAFVMRGDPDSVAEQIIQFRENVGPFGTLLMTAHDWLDKPKMLRSMELMAKEVMPAVNQKLGLLKY